MARLLFAPEQPSFESQYWKSLSTALTHLEISTEEERLTNDTSSALCQLTRLQRLRLTSLADTDARIASGIINLDLPLLQQLRIECLIFEAIHLKCPKLEELELYRVSVKSFSGMPSHIRKVHLNRGGGNGAFARGFACTYHQFARGIGDSDGCFAVHRP